MKLLDGSEIAGFIKERQAKAVRNLRQSWKTIPTLAIVQTVDNPVIDTYVRLKRRYAEDILIECELHKVAQPDAQQTIEALNARDDVHGIIVQLPLADPTQTDEIVNLVAPEKDVDGMTRDTRFDAATPMAINWLLAAYNIDLTKAHIAIVGDGRLVGAPLARMWRTSGYDIASFDEDKPATTALLKKRDVIVSATGVPGLITSEMVTQNAVIVDAGTASENGVIKGDVADEVRERTDITITPLKGGVGPLTIAALFDNVITAARNTTNQ